MYPSFGRAQAGPRGVCGVHCRELGIVESDQQREAGRHRGGLQPGPRPWHSAEVLDERFRVSIGSDASKLADQQVGNCAYSVPDDPNSVGFMGQMTPAIQWKGLHVVDHTVDEPASDGVR